MSAVSFETDPRQAAWGRQLLEFWSLYNDEYLGGALRPPTLRLGDAQATLGSWCVETHRGWRFRRRETHMSGIFHPKKVYPKPE